MGCMHQALACLAHLASHRPRSPCLHQQQQQRRSAPPGRRGRPGCCCEVQARRARPMRGELSQASQGLVSTPIHKTTNYDELRRTTTNYNELRRTTTALIRITIIRSVPGLASKRSGPNRSGPDYFVIPVPNFCSGPDSQVKYRSGPVLAHPCFAF